MFDVLTSYFGLLMGYFTQRGHSSFERALLARCGAKDLAIIGRECGRSHLLGRLAEYENTPRCELLQSVASQIGIGVATSVDPPTDELIRWSGHDPSSLRAHYAVPQSSVVAPAGYALAVADPDAIDVQEFEQRGVQILLGFAEDIDTAWQRWRLMPNSTVCDDDLRDILIQLASDSSKLGAKEVFIGHPTDGTYEFVSNGRRFSGELDASIFRSLREVLQVNPELSFDSESGVRYRAALTRSFERVVICYTWDGFDGPSRPIRIVSPDTLPEAALTTTKAIAMPTAPIPLLLIDDDPRFLIILESVLEQRGFAPTRVASGPAALHSLSESKFGAIICDVHMPSMDGPAFVHELRKTDRSTPVCMLTSDSDQLLEAELALLGANAYVRKQDDPRVLVAWLQNLTSNYAASSQ
ncbi:MAG: response regulator [Bdellovibrionota bacterium]